MTSRTEYNNPKSSGAFCLPYHYELVSDKKRVMPFKCAIEHTSRGKRVLDCGTGTGVFALLAAKAGAKKVYAVDSDPVVLRFARQNITRGGYGHVIKLIPKDILKVSLKDLDDERVDVVITENLSTWQVTEPQIPFMNHVNRFLIQKRGVRIPRCVYNFVELVHSQYSFLDVVEVRTYYFGFTGIQAPKSLSAKIEVSQFDFRKIHPLIVEKTIRVRVTRSGVLNSIRCTSSLKVANGITFQSSDSLL